MRIWIGSKVIKALSTTNQRIDLHKVILHLLEEKKKLESVISSLEILDKPGAGAAIGNAEQATRRRGRKHMSLEERRRVSERMKKYWATRGASRETNGSPEAPASPVIEADRLPPASEVREIAEKRSRKRQ